MDPNSCHSLETPFANNSAPLYDFFLSFSFLFFSSLFFFRYLPPAPYGSAQITGRHIVDVVLETSERTLFTYQGYSSGYIPPLHSGLFLGNNSAPSAAGSQAILARWFDDMITFEAPKSISFFDNGLEVESLEMWSPGSGVSAAVPALITTALPPSQYPSKKFQVGLAGYVANGLWTVQRYDESLIDHANPHPGSYTSQLSVVGYLDENTGKALNYTCSNAGRAPGIIAFNPRDETVFYAQAGVRQYQGNEQGLYSVSDSENDIVNLQGIVKGAGVRDITYDPVNNRACVIGSNSNSQTTIRCYVNETLVMTHSASSADSGLAQASSLRIDPKTQRMYYFEVVMIVLTILYFFFFLMSFLIGNSNC